MSQVKTVTPVLGNLIPLTNCLPRPAFSTQCKQQGKEKGRTEGLEVCPFVFLPHFIAAQKRT